MSEVPETRPGEKARRLTRQILLWALCLPIGIAWFYLVCGSHFPVSNQLSHDEAEHLHVAARMAQGQRPYLDFLENHPMLFNHFAWWLKGVTGADTMRAWATAVRGVILAHVLLALLVQFLWMSETVGNRPRGATWCALWGLGLFLTRVHDPQLMTLFNIRPDWIAYAWTVMGCYLYYRNVCAGARENTSRAWIELIAGAFCVGIGNAVLPKGTIFVVPLGLLMGARLLERWQTGNDLGLKRFQLLATVAFCSVTVTTLAGAILLDCILSRVPLSTWVKGVILLNGNKHIPHLSAENNPISHLVLISGLGFPALLLFVLWVLWELGQPRERRAGGDVLLYCVMLIAVNLVVAPFGNGLTWPWYFIPSFMALAAIFQLLVLRVHGLALTLPRGAPLRKSAMIHGIACVLLAHWGFQLVEAFQIRQLRRALAHFVTRGDLVYDHCLPRDLLYFAIRPKQAPIMARSWGYHFMLFPDRNLWRDNARLGLGPPLSDQWERGWGKEVPDVLCVPTHDDLVNFVSTLFITQKVNAEWLLREARNHFTLMTNGLIEVYVRNDRLARFRERGWKPYRFRYSADTVYRPPFSSGLPALSEPGT